jgi:hypothetical protein
MELEDVMDAWSTMESDIDILGRLLARVGLPPEAEKMVITMA